MKMKHTLIAVTYLLFTLRSFGQHNPAGTWEGTLKVGVDLRLVFHISSDGGSFSATADSPDQNAFGLPTDSVWFVKDSIVIWMNALNARYEGRMVNDSFIRGQFTQGVAFTLDLKKVDKPTEKTRTQIPRAPFPYKEENVKYRSPDGSIEFGATLTLPEGEGPHPAVILISGSGPQDRNSTLMGHPSFWVLADHLSRNGYAVLRYDDR